ncbi:hypothetical protein C8R43DRAFT_590003 [Mycena crocata]|nr:hypothetical protein C8R43DRAFT_590003 [Mycena crocata]
MGNRSDSQTAQILAEKLTDLMTSSSHLLLHVRSLDIDVCTEQTLLPIARIAWPRLEALSLGLLQQSLEPSLLDYIHTLVSLPSLRRLSFWDRWKRAHLQSVVAHCTSALRSIFFFHCDENSESISTLPSAVSTPIRVRELTLFFSPHIANLLGHPAFPIDFSALTLLRLSQSMSTAVTSFLRLAGATITHLQVDGISDGLQLQQLDLSMMSALTDITIWHPALLVLKRLPAGNRVAHVRIRLYDSDVEDFASSLVVAPTTNGEGVGPSTDDGDTTTTTTPHLVTGTTLGSSDSDTKTATHASALEDLVLRTLPALRRLDVEASTYGRKVDVVGIIQAALPRLHEKNMLSVEHYM